MKEGDRVIIQDFSDAHGDNGTVWAIQDNGIILVELDTSYDCSVLWPVTSEKELIPE